jgi:hypothetical protein
MTSNGIRARGTESLGKKQNFIGSVIRHVSMVVARLVENRLVRRAASPGDARRLSISITPAGRALLKRSPDAAQTRLIAALKAMSRSQLKALSENLALLANLIEEEGSNPARGRKGGGGKSGIALGA